jgi:hypothetical protein
VGSTEQPLVRLQVFKRPEMRIGINKPMLLVHNLQVRSVCVSFKNNYVKYAIAIVLFSVVNLRAKSTIQSCTTSGRIVL